MGNAPLQLPEGVDETTVDEDRNADDNTVDENWESLPLGDENAKQLCTGCTTLLQRTPLDTDSCSSRPLPMTSSWLSLSEEDTLEMERDLLSFSDTTPVVDLLSQDLWIVTTAALPWCTGTSLNPLLRAAYLLERKTRGKVVLVVPWLEQAPDRELLFGAEAAEKCSSMEEQEEYIRDWLQQQVSAKASQALQLQWYPARYHKTLSSIFAMGDPFNDLDWNVENDVVILEEPEHLNYFRVPTLRQRPYTLGIVHTNYKYYAQQYAIWTAPAVAALSSALVRAHVDQVVKLSGVLQTYAAHKECVCNVHGIREEFLQVGPVTGGIYFIGKLLWAKGLDRLVVLQEYYRKQHGEYFAMDIYGSGPEEDEIRNVFLGKKSTVIEDEDSKEDESTTTDTSTKKSTDALIFSWARLARKALPVQFRGRVNHAEVSAKIFVNPSVSEVLCTTTAEAIAMGKFVILPKHASNDFFNDFPNALFYRTPTEFCSQLEHALANDPTPMSPELSHRLTWSAATDRLLDTVVSQRQAARRKTLYGKEDAKWEAWHVNWSQGRKGDMLRTLLGGGPVAKQAAYQEEQSVQCS